MNNIHKFQLEVLHSRARLPGPPIRPVLGFRQSSSSSLSCLPNDGLWNNCEATAERGAVQHRQDRQEKQMAEIRAFRGIRYRLDRPEAAGDLVAPPYDVISPAQHTELEDRHPHNVVRLELPRDEPGDDDRENRYTRAAALFRCWLDQGVFAREPQPAMYVYGQQYEVEGRHQERLGIMASLQVEPFESGVVLPHEQTFPKHKEDRYRLLTTARAQFSPIFGLYAAPGAHVRDRLAAVAERTPAALAVDPEGVCHRLWAVTDAVFLDWAASVLRDQPVFIADGHHRYETALRHRQERRAENPDAPPAWYDFVMTFLVEMHDPGLVLLPTHRLIRSPLPGADQVRQALEPHFEMEPVSLADAEVLRHHQLGLVLPGGAAWRLTLRDPAAMAAAAPDRSEAWRDLDVAILHRLVLREALQLDQPEVIYSRDSAEAREAVLRGECSGAFFLPHPRVEELKAVADHGERMPEKSTYFWPKAISGLVFYGE
jgi:uncharacterized protein (DUF1015 family)